VAGFICYLTVLKHPTGDATNGGVSGGGQPKLALYRADVDPDSVAIITPAVIISTNAYSDPIIVPLLHKPAGAIGPMFGGNYAIGDGRLGEEIKRVTGKRFYGAVAIHDRWETLAQYEAVTR
jgi:hypothetical protein